MEVLDNAAPALAVHVNDDAFEVRVRGGRADGDAGGGGHDLEEGSLDTDASGDAEGVSLGILHVEVAGVLDDGGDLLAAAVARGAEVEDCDGEVVVLRGNVSQRCGYGRCSELTLGSCRF